MTVGDIIEKILGAFGVEPRKSRVLRERVMAVKARITNMEDGLRDVRRDVSALEDRIADLKRDLKTEKSEHGQDLIMDEIERLDKEFERKHDLANLKGENVDAARALRSKLEQLLENAVNGSNPAELESVLERVEAMDSDLSDVRKLMTELDKPSAASAAKKSVKAEKKAQEDRAARRARLLGEAAPEAKPAAAKKEAPSAAKEAVAAPAAAEPATPEGQTVVAR